MSKERKALKLALEALKSITWVNSFNEGDYLTCNFKSVETSITAIKEALAQPEQPDLDAICQDLQEKTYSQAMRIAELEAKLAQPEQESSSVTYKEVTDTMNALYAGDSKQVQIAMAMESKKLYTIPPPVTESHKQEPVAFEAWYQNAIWGNEDFKAGCKRAWNAAIKHTTPPQRTWVGLTDEEMFKTWLTVPAETEERLAFGRAVEAKLKEKNT